MDDTTLVTFIVDCEPGTRCVDLYGSWDNFHKPYSLSKDKQMGHGRWHYREDFHNIICDGDPSQPTEPRQGRLKTGGTYWFYYKINDDLERPNMDMPTTTKCLLLPGQMVNVLEVPRLNHDETPDVSGEPFLEMSLDPESRKTSFGTGPTSTRKPDSSSEVLDWRRLEYLEKCLGRLKTAAGHTHMLTCLGHTIPPKSGMGRLQRPMTAPRECREPAFANYRSGEVMPRRPTADDRKSSIRTQSSSASGTLASAREHATIQRSFSNPFRGSRHRQVTNGVTCEAKIGHQHTLSTVEELRSVASPVSEGLDLPSESSQQPKALVLHDSDVGLTADTYRHETDRGSRARSDLQLRLACARLEVARAEASSRSAYQELSPSQYSETSVISEDLRTYHRRSSMDTNHAHLNHAASDSRHRYSEALGNAGFSHMSAFSTPISASPISQTASTSTWGSPFRRSTVDDAQTPVTEYDWRGSRSRASQLYSLANSRDGLGLLSEDLSLASQETIKQNQRDKHSVGTLQISSAFPATSAQPESPADSQTSQKVGSTTHNVPSVDELTSELTYLGFAIH